MSLFAKLMRSDVEVESADIPENLQVGHSCGLEPPVRSGAH